MQPAWSGSVTRYIDKAYSMSCLFVCDHKTMYDAARSQFTNEEYYLTSKIFEMDLHLRHNRKIFPHGALYLPWHRYQQHPPAPVTQEGGQR